MSISKFVFIVLLSGSLAPGCSPPPSSNQSHGKSPSFSEEIQTVLNRERNLLHSELDNPAYVEILRRTNDKKETLLPEVIQRLDQEWAQNSPKDVLAQTILNSGCSDQLRFFQEAHEEFAEVFITDAQGLNVCMTNKTSDYYQADEDWWISTNASNDPYGLHGPIEFDTSSSTESISLYLPVLDPATGNKLGILKAVVKLTDLAEGL